MSDRSEYWKVYYQKNKHRRQRTKNLETEKRYRANVVKRNVKGIAKVTSKGTTYWYAWRGGPRLRGEEGSPEWWASYNEAIADRHIPDPGCKARNYQRKLRDCGIRLPIAECRALLDL